MEKLITRDEALALLRQYNKEPFHLQHALTVEAVMRWFANDLGYGEEADFWPTSGRCAAFCTISTLKCGRSSTA